MLPNTKNSTTSLFYEPLKSFLYERLSEKWQEEVIILYDCVVMIQDEIINSFIESDIFAQNSRFKMN